MAAKPNILDPSDYVKPQKIVFHVHKTEKDDYATTMSNIETDIAEKERSIESQRKMKESLLALQKEARQKEIEELKLQKRQLIKEAEDLERRLTLYKNREDIDESLDRLAKCKEQIAQIELQLPTAELDRVVKKEVEPKPLSTTKAIMIGVGLLLFTSLVFWVFALYKIDTDPSNDSLRRILNSTGFRLTLNFIFWACSLLVSVSYLYFFNRDLWLWFHNRINSTVSFQNDFIQCQPSDRLKFFTQNFWAAAFLFAVCLLVIMG